MRLEPGKETAIEIKPCPFCGNQKIKIHNDYSGSPALMFECEKCGAMVGFENEMCRQLPELAIANWNKRPKNGED